MHEKNRLPIVYSCSGCSSAAQAANYIALRLDREGRAEMSCIAGVGGDVQSHVSLAKGQREIIAIDGCPLACTKKCLARHEVTPAHHFVLTDLGVRKEKHCDLDPREAESVKEQILELMGHSSEE